MKKSLHCLFIIILLASSKLYSQNLIFEEDEKWDGSSWQPNDTITYTYDSNGYQAGIISHPNSWKSLMTNNSSGQILTQINLLWNGSSWDSSRTTNTYDANGNMLMTIGENYSSGSWVLSSKRVNTYDTSNYLTNQIDLNWNSGTNSWENYDSVTYTNNTDGNSILEIVKWASGGIAKSSITYIVD